jgi:hypothetical protein
LCFSTRNIEDSHKMWRELENFGTWNKIHARVVLEMAVFPALSPVILILLIGKLHSFHRWSWFLRWCSKFPLILIIMVKLKIKWEWPLWHKFKSFTMKNEIFVVMKLKFLLHRQFETFRQLGMVVKFYSLPF